VNFTVNARAVRKNAALNRYELDTEGGMAFANYRLVDQAVVITHVETPAALRGHGVGSHLVEGALDLIRAEGLKVVAGCSFARAYLAEHPEYADLRP
jgi:predicted GNAT family acetyltransferase